MIIHGKEYDTTSSKDKSRGIAKRRAVYHVCGAIPAPEQQIAIDRLEKGFHGDWEGRDPYNEMRQAIVRGIELNEEELWPDGKWRMCMNEDALMSLGQMGAL